MLGASRGWSPLVISFTTPAQTRRPLGTAVVLIGLLAVACTSEAGPAPSSVSRPSSASHVTSPAPTPTSTGTPTVELAAAPPAVARDCAATARSVGYAVACPTLLPVGSSTVRDVPDFMTPAADRGPLAHWVAFNAEFPAEGTDLDPGYLGGKGHLAIVISPRPASARQMIYHGSVGQIPFAGSDHVDGVTGRWYVVIGESLFTSHLVLVWTVGGHSYAVGFHSLGQDSRRLGLQVARHLALVPPG
jgi:hypothetical protein